ncbi:hypothetical protein GCM10022243_13810 [Saccharothrix violaceirubra]|uniref:F5/8 type C domain-containing protein n=1 Tax=Saccharothrix violaceirubra TaxID=413306 RepID=A0A7W7T660_9PSEU|nr:hypothetical protein [Saccharothrix violaceirubra]MBB4967255.1 hypothetical protein [Saccharothrix violaceirubra]
MSTPVPRPLRAALALLGLAVVIALAPAAVADPTAGTPGLAEIASTPTMWTPPSSSSTTPPPTSSSVPSSTMPPVPDENIARGGVAQASSTFPGYSAAKVNDGDTATTLGGDHSWANAEGRSPTTNPEWVFVRWSEQRSVGRIVVYTSDGYPLRDFDVQVLHESGGWWDTVRTYNYNTSSKVSLWFAPRKTVGVKILAKVGPSHQPIYTRVNEIQVFAY